MILRLPYPYNEVEVLGDEGAFRVDPYDPAQGAIVARNFTQFSNVKEETGITYLQELENKYPSGATISNSPFNPKVLRGPAAAGRPDHGGPGPEVDDSAAGIELRPGQRPGQRYYHSRHRRPRVHATTQEMSCQYFEKWVGSQKTGIKPLSEAQAAARHERKQPYVAVALDEEGKQCVVQLNSSGAYVLFLDEMQRGYLSYQFDNHSSGKLFLSISIFREYADASGDPVKVTTFKFRPDGAMEIYVSDRQTSEEQEKTGTADASPNWEEYPAFGQYSGLCRVNRVPA